ncbi:non-homologous end-joining DNA ligase [Anaeromyxobacter diazotrophicus]|uniref:ATP-dependent DNA ligase n=1 Tax=Anaeromyxobacter diazotrophicus TaxID=2590199 RepID=A0A7I9VIC8_9BACT|nr:non-homologous end-joining DNA ligase [Anaeromyxobacter diazotrophicus]GEJ56115.1 ATP-dependent DNA ligase [Anaeromyxobacter diazotrophicus]
MSARRAVEVQIGGRRLELSNLEKVFYPATGFTKGQVIDYYLRIAPALLPHLRDRPLTLKRYPEGAQGPHFYEKRCPAHRPAWLRTAGVWSGVQEEEIRFCVVDDLASLIWAVNLADLEMHTYLHRAPAVDRPTALVFDLDPGPPADVVQCCEVARVLKGLFDRLGLASFPKTSGSKGLQVYVPLNTPVGYAATKPFARAVAELLERERPDLVVSSMKKALRAGKVLVDWSQNDAHKTTVCAWSLRAKERPTVSTPLRWEEVEAALAARDPAALAFDAAEALRRFERDGDLFAPVLKLRQRLPAAGVGAAPGPAPERGRRAPGGRRSARSPGRKAGRKEERTPPPGGGPGTPEDGYLSS